MFCPSCKVKRYSKQWSPLQWQSWFTVLQAQDGERNCCSVCSINWYQPTFPEVAPWKRYINPGDGNYWCHNPVTGEWFYEKTGTTALPPQESGKSCSESPFTDIPYTGATGASEESVFSGINDVIPAAKRKLYFRGGVENYDFNGPQLGRGHGSGT